jgi:2,3-bisphosphoglycerate-independent phosphoglycerate mutase
MTTAQSERPRPLVLCILDGFGERAERDANAIRLAKTPAIDAIRTQYPGTLIGTSGPDVGLPPGQMGNSEVGHLNFGAGRIALTDISRIDVAVADHSLGSNEIIRRQIHLAKDKKCRLHLFGLVSDGGVHSSLAHLLELIDAASWDSVPVVVHAFLDGRDTPPKSAGPYLDRLVHHLDGGKKGVVGTIAGRYWAMDRDKRYDRVQKAYTAIVRGEAPSEPDVFTALHQAYARGQNDEFVEPVRIGDYQGIVGDFKADFASKSPVWEWVGEEVGFAFNFRPDRMREISALFMRRNCPPEVLEFLTDRGKPVVAFDDHHYAGMSEYDPALKLAVAFPKEQITESFGELIARAGLTQFRCAETEKYAHVTYFFNGGREEPFTGEERSLVPSPRDVPTYDKKPEMSAPTVTSEVVNAIKSGKYDFVLVNFANPDMVGHTGVLDAAVSAVQTVDDGVGAIANAVREAKGALIVTADHGNCEQMKDEKGEPHTAHTLNPVPLYYLNDRDKDVTLERGRICDVAPMMLDILGLPKPEAMTGHSLRKPRS